MLRHVHSSGRVLALAAGLSFTWACAGGAGGDGGAGGAGTGGAGGAGTGGAGTGGAGTGGGGVASGGTAGSGGWAGGGAAGGPGVGDGDAGTGGGDRFLIVATSWTARRVNLADGQTSEVFKDVLKWQQNPGHHYQHWDPSPDGKHLVVYHEYGGTGAPSADDRIVLWDVATESVVRVLLDKNSAVGEFPSSPCFSSDGETVFVIGNGAVWSLDATRDKSAQTPTTVSAISDASQFTRAKYWNAGCTSVVGQGYPTGNTNTDAQNVVHLDPATGVLTKISDYAAGGKTLAQEANFPGCSGSACVTATSGGIPNKMGFMLDGTVWFQSNRDYWQDSGGSFLGTPVQVFVYDPAAPAAFAAMTPSTADHPFAVSRSGSHYAKVVGEAIHVFDSTGALVVQSSADFNAANAPGRMRFSF